MKAASFSRYFSALALLAGLSACYHREANLLVAPIPIQIDSSRIEGRGVPAVGPRWHRIEAGMTKEEVLYFAGEPTRREYDGSFPNGNVETWYYDSYEVHDGHFDPHKVTFDRGRVTLMVYDQARFNEKLRERSEAARRAVLAEIVPEDVGIRCVTDDQCLSKKCINNRCSGPHGCTRPVGGDCMTDLDCCSHHCDVAGYVCRN